MCSSDLGRLSEDSSDAVIQYLKDNGLELKLIIETHAHADHLSGAQLLKKAFSGAQIAISERITQVQEVFTELFHLGHEVASDGSQFDYLIKDFEEVEVAGFKVKALPTPGHTPACTSYLIGDAVFTGDAIFMPDFGTGRCDFPKGSANQLFKSITSQLYKLPDETKIFVGHDYQPGGRELKFETSVAEQKETNIHLRADTTEREFVAFREGRDAKLGAPKLLLPSLQVNIRGGRLPQPEANGVSYLKLPLK